MRTVAKGLIGLVALLGCKTQSADFEEYSASRPQVQEEVSSLRDHPDFFAWNATEVYVPRDQLVSVLAAEANRDEFQVVYFPEDGLLRNITSISSVDRVENDLELREAVIASGKEFYMIHNHNDRELESALEKEIPYYWIGASREDIEQYIAISVRTPKITSGIITKYGLLTFKTDARTLELMSHAFMGSSIRTQLKQESVLMQKSLTDQLPSLLESWAASYRGILSLSFEAVK